MLSGLAEFVDHHSIHLYTGCADHYATVFQSHHAERAIRICAALIERVRYAQRIAHPIAHRVRRVERVVPDAEPRGPRGRRRGALHPHRRARRGRLPERVHPALPGRPRSPTSPSSSTRSPRSSRARAGSSCRRSTIPCGSTPSTRGRSRLDVHVSGETYDGPVVEDPSGRVHHVADLGPFTLLDATATCDADGGALTVAVVNRDRDRAHAATHRPGRRRRRAGRGAGRGQRAGRRRAQRLRRPRAGRRDRAPPRRGRPAHRARLPRPLGERAPAAPGPLTAARGGALARPAFASSRHVQRATGRGEPVACPPRGRFTAKMVPAVADGPIISPSPSWIVFHAPAWARSCCWRVLALGGCFLMSLGRDAEPAVAGPAPYVEGCQACHASPVVAQLRAERPQRQGHPLRAVPHAGRTSGLRRARARRKVRRLPPPAVRADRGQQALRRP